MVSPQLMRVAIFLHRTQPYIRKGRLIGRLGLREIGNGFLDHDDRQRDRGC